MSFHLFLGLPLLVFLFTVPSGAMVGRWPAVLTVGAAGVCLDFFSLVYQFISFSFSLSLGDGPI